jgi:hypothetical protein
MTTKFKFSCYCKFRKKINMISLMLRDDYDFTDNQHLILAEN